MSRSATPALARRTDPAALRGDEATLFLAHNAALVHAVRRAVQGSDALVEDACQSAWAILLRAQPNRATVFAWLLTVAIHEAWRLSAADRRSCPLTRPDDTELDGLDRAHDDPDPAVRALARLHAQMRLRAVGEVLNERQRRLIALQAIGCSYAELAALTGDTPRTVDRQLARAKRRLDPLREPLAA